ncbi:hypothetical protein ORV05_05500 [Amycolatopsis cynarae]|uniref:DUF304 domain-containing protein n=1 Tax=Amycolatopsis cynarae TaxID=2995223 RepID=A0ABY7B7S5_9PSEU|nr:hypothetical protein [Amycolatopsis sp. HUAS 11-8]WAL67243.1 hypothetical protein ORV05_05500 [Amycolatopsis sp. HUAS 11-8]
MTPAISLPALESDSTALHLARLRARGRFRKGWLVWLPVFGFRLLVLDPALVDYVVASGGLALGVVWVLQRWWRYTRWAVRIEPWLAAGPWREVPATLAGRRVVAGGTVYALRGAPAEVRRVIGRTGRVWLAGDATVAAVRIDGSGRPWPAVRRSRAGVPVSPPDIDHLWRERRGYRVLTGLSLVLAAAFLALVVGTVIEPPESGELGDALFLYALVLVPWTVVGYRRRRFRRRIRRYAGEWRTITAAVADVDFTGGGPRFVPGWAVLPGGLPVRFVIRKCPLDLYAHIWFHRKLAVQGGPRDDEVLVGIPGFPVAAAAFLFPRKGTRPLAVEQDA